MTDDPDWKSKLVDQLVKPATGPLAEYFGIWHDKLRVKRYRQRIELLKELDSEGLLDPSERDRQRLLFDGDRETDEDSDK